MRLQYSSDADAAYLQLADEIGPGGVASTYLCDTTQIGGMINLDFDSGGRLVGIEIMDASKFLPPEALAEARVQS
jgi:uncharacterized protein YuzE